MEVSTASRSAAAWRPSAALAGFAVVAVTRALTLPRSLWELDEVHFARGVEFFEPLGHRPHPPGYPLLIGLGKLFNLVFHDPFASLVALSFLSCLIGYCALVAAFRRMAGEDAAAGRVAVAGALLFHLSPVMLVQGPLPMSDPAALMFVSLALLAGAVLAREGSFGAALGLGASASAAIGCRPQFALVVLPMLAVALWQAPGWRRRFETVAAFTAASLAWFIPLVVATGGWRELVAYQMKQASYVAGADATVARAGFELSSLATRFVAHPWGPRWLALPVLALALAGTVHLLRRRAVPALPLAALTAAQLALCLLVMDPGDGVRYALPAVLGVAFAAAAGCGVLASLVRRPAVVWAAVGAVAVAAAVYAWPVLAVRSTTLSPAAQAVGWAESHLPRGAVILVGEEMAPFGTFLLRGFDVAFVEAGLRRTARRPRAPVYLLAEGESAWKGAVTFRWPDSDPYRRLTRNYYRVISLSPIPADRRFQVVRGVHGWEPSLLDARWRWLEPDAAIRLFPRRDRAVAVTLGLDMAAPVPSNTVDVSVNGTPVATVEVGRGLGGRTIRLPLPQSGPAEIAFRSARSFVPAESGAGRDTRRLAVQLLTVERIVR
jgi:hypothetical protein